MADVCELCAIGTSVTIILIFILIINNLKCYYRSLNYPYECSFNNHNHHRENSDIILTRSSTSNNDSIFSGCNIY